MKKYNSFLGAFLSGDDGKSGYNAGYRKSALAELYQSQDPMKQQEALKGLARVDPEAAGGWQRDNQAAVQQHAKLLVALGKDNPVAVQAWETRVKPELVRMYGDQAAALTLEEAMPYAQQIAGGSDGVPSQLQYFRAMTDGLSPEDQLRARRIELGLDPRTSSAAISYKEIMGADGRKRLVAVDPRTPGAIVIDGSGQQQGRSYTPTEANAMSDGSGWQAPTDPAAINANKIVQSFLNAGFTPQQAGEMADMYLAKERPNGGTVTVDSANPFVSMTPAEIARLEAQAKADVALGMEPAIEGAKAKAKADVELATAPSIEGAKAGAKIGAEADAKRKAEAPMAMQKSLQLFQLINKAINHPGRKAATGASAVLPWDYAAGTDAKDFLTVQNQLEGKAFLEAFESLKGGGQITEIEGTKATQAMARLERAQSEEEYVAALNELKTIAALAYKRAKDAMNGKQTQTPAAPAGEPQRIRIKL